MSSDATVLREAAPAKINLFLHIVGRRPDGMHLIDSLVVFAELGDVVTVRPGTDISLTRSGSMAGDLPPIEDDLVFRAARLLAEMAQVSAGATINVEKNLPVASGLGGGSADAAATIRALVRMWRIDMPSDQMASLTQQLGADVAVCLESRPLRVGGIGEQVSPPGTLAPLHAVLVNPHVAVSTAEVFAAFADATQAPVSGPDGTEPWSGEPRRFVEQLAARHNDLTAAATTLCPAIGVVLARLGAQPECLLQRMCGSGATCFGLFAASSEAQAAAETMRRENPDWWVAATALNTGEV